MFNIIILGITSLLTDMSSEMVYPVLPLYLTLRLGVTPAIVGLIEGIAESLASILKVFSGYISDRTQRRKPLAIIGYASSSIGKVFIYLSTSWGLVLLGRVVDRFGKGIRTAPRDALIADSTAHDIRGTAYGLHRTMDTAGAVVGVGLAYYFIKYYKGDYKFIFLLSIIPASFGVLALSFAIEKAPKIIKTKITYFTSFRELDFRLKAFLIIIFIFSLGNSSNQFLLLRAKGLGVKVESVILLYLIYNGVYSLLSYPAGKISDIIGRRWLLVSGYICYGFVYLLFAIINSFIYLWILFAIYGVYMAFTEGVEKAFVSDAAPADKRATLIGLHATLVGIGLLPASILAGILWSMFGPRAPFYFGGLIGFLSGIALSLVIKSEKDKT
jgi:MFS family permease